MSIFTQNYTLIKLFGNYPTHLPNGKDCVHLIAEKIFPQLSQKDLENCALLNKSWYQLIYQKDFVSVVKIIKHFILKPLQQNPLDTNQPTGFGYFLPENHPYYVQHPEWCDGSSNGYATIHTKEYDETLEQCRKKLGLTQTEEMLGEREKQLLGEIDRAISNILKELKHEIPNKKTINIHLLTVYEKSLSTHYDPYEEGINLYPKSNASI